MGTAVSGAPEPELDAAIKRFEPLLEKAWAARDAGEINRLRTWLWLDGPGQPEGRVGGAARKLAIDMNAIIIGNGVPETAGAAGIDAWHRDTDTAPARTDHTVPDREPSRSVTTERNNLSTLSLHWIADSGCVGNRALCPRFSAEHPFRLR